MLMTRSPLWAQHTDTDTVLYQESDLRPADSVAPYVEEEVPAGSDDEETYPAVITSAEKRNAAGPTAEQWSDLTRSEAYGYRDKKEFVQQITPPAPPKEPSGLFRAIQAIINFLASTPGKILLFLILALIIGYIVYRIVSGQGGGLFGKRDRQKEEMTPELDEGSLQEGAWEAALRKALSDGDNRAAIRFAWLHALQLLQERGHIAFRQDKTNIQYYREVGEAVKPTFRALSRQYEYAWYGGHLPDETSLAAYMQSYKNLTKGLNNA